MTECLHIGFTGTQRGLTEAQDNSLSLALRLLTNWSPTYEKRLHHGDCIGADERADEIARSLGITPVVHPPLRHGKRAFVSAEGAIYREPKEYLYRNQDIVDSSDILIGTPSDFIMPTDFRGQGTWSTINRALKRQGLQVAVIFPDGTVNWNYRGNPSSQS